MMCQVKNCRKMGMQKDTGGRVGNDFTQKVLGTIRTPYKEPTGMPIQGIFKPDELGYAEIFDEFTDCLKGVDMFSHLLLFYYFHAVTEEKMIHQPYLEDVDYASIATRDNQPQQAWFFRRQVSWIRKSKSPNLGSLTPAAASGLLSKEK